MPTIGSVSGSFGYGRSPQVAPLPGFSIYPKIGTKASWSFSSNGTFIFDGNTTYSNITNPAFSLSSGNCYVITPTTNFRANVKIWGAGGGAGSNTLSRSRAGPGFFNQWPWWGRGMLLFRQAFASPTSEMPSSAATSRRGCCQTRL